VTGTSELTPEVARWLTGDEGLDHVAAVTAALDDGEDELTVAARLRRDGLDAARATAVAGAAHARRRARRRWPDAERLLFTPLALEQASDPDVSAWRAQRLAGRRVADLGAGVGGDTLALAAAGARVTAVDLDEARLVLLAHNARVRGLDVEVEVGDATAHRPPAGAAVHADPGRRRGGRRVRRLRDHEPPVPALLAAHAHAPAVGVVLSPAVDLDDPDLPADAELEFVQVGDDLVEAVAWLGDARLPGVAATASLLPAGAASASRLPAGAATARPGPAAQRRSRPHGPRERLPVGEVGRWLLDPAPAVVRARLHDALGAEVGARRLAARRALLTVDDAPPDGPWWRRRQVHAALPARPKAVRAWLRSRQERPVELVLHGVDADLDAWWRALGRPPRGPAGWRVELVRTDTGVTALVTTSDRPPATGGGAAR
jgi:SAM-dependent methyltransferase